MGKKPHKRNGKQGKIRRQNAAAFRNEAKDPLIKKENDGEEK